MYVPPISERSELLLGLPVKHKLTLFISSARKVEQINSAISLLSEMTVTFSFDLQILLSCSFFISWQSLCSRWRNLEVLAQNKVSA
jgi:hypothetical protein